ncbi:aspartyl aminopeptidase [Litorivivens lipolytica]|uniref:M18 family aminopeptidase n=1 Tax=Litorivivens lipolytica TaxID=1524264 RepID=A0A7W4W2L4_9GAMM|nr:M18 family aminopeptidase [Litorivivens lipolytica]MBB3046018.1 aspartyl aminopeptidase [Litorivivens lipolytica]
MIEQNAFNEDMLAFLEASPTPFHAVAEMSRRLVEAGFTELNEADAWQLKPGGKYYVQRNQSSLVAFVYGQKPLLDGGWRLWGAHTDSPCLKLKPHADLEKKGYRQWGVQVYGGALLNPWFDRDLSLAGRVHFKTSEGKHRRCLINLKRPIAIIPSLAIHLDREANNSRTVNPQTDMPPIVCHNEGDTDLQSLLLEHLRGSGYAVANEVVDFDLSLFDTQAPAQVGWRNEFIASARLDNLLSCYVGLAGLLAAGDATHSVLVCNDHEEVGSQSAIGAQGPMLKAILKRIVGSYEDFERAINRSLMVSADNAHGVHPNYADRHDNNHGPLLNAGPVIKINANQRYASTSETNTLFSAFCKACDVPVQQFVIRSDMGCGSTIGPITSSELGVRTVDIGVPTFAMHSCRELAGSSDAHGLAKVARHFMACETLPEV